MPNTEIDFVHCRHAGRAGPKACHGQPHTVEYHVGKVKRRDDYEVVILRHGIARPLPLISSPKPVQLRQLLPYFVEG